MRMKFESTNNNILPLFFIASLVFIDQFSKYIIRSSGGFYICNRGISFGLVLPPLIFWLFWTVITFVLFIFLILKLEFRISNQKQNQKSKKFDIWILNFIWNNLGFGFWTSQVTIIGLIFILSGAVSNILDRLYFGCVIDFIKLPYWQLFNLADAFISIGVIISVWHLTKTKQIL